MPPLDEADIEGIPERVVRVVHRAAVGAYAEPRVVRRENDGGKVAYAIVAGPIAFLCSPLSSYMFGEVLSVNGGAVMA